MAEKSFEVRIFLKLDVNLHGALFCSKEQEERTKLRKIEESNTQNSKDIGVAILLDPFLGFAARRSIACSYGPGLDSQEGFGLAFFLH